MNPIRSRSRKVLALALPVAASALLLSGCVPLDAPAPAPTPSASTPAPVATAETLTWENCSDPVITAGKAKEKGWKFVAASQVRNSPGAAETHSILDEPLVASIVWDAGGPGSTRFDEKIGEVIQHPATGSLGGLSQVNKELYAIQENGNFIGFQAVNQLQVPVTLVCDESLSASGTVNTWEGSETGILDCDLRHDPNKMGPVVTEAKKLYCQD